MCLAVMSYIRMQTYIDESLSFFMLYQILCRSTGKDEKRWKTSLIWISWKYFMYSWNFVDFGWFLYTTSSCTRTKCEQIFNSNTMEKSGIWRFFSNFRIFCGSLFGPELSSSRYAEIHLHVFLQYVFMCNLNHIWLLFWRKCIQFQSKLWDFWSVYISKFCEHILCISIVRTLDDNCKYFDSTDF